MRVGKAVSPLTIIIMVILMYEVIMRYIFTRPTTWAGEVAWILFVVLVTLGWSYVLYEDKHIRVDLIYGRFGPKGKAAMDVATFIMVLLFLVTITWPMLRLTWHSISIMERSTTYFRAPLYIPKIFTALAFLLLLLQAVARFIQNIGVIKGVEKESNSNEH